MTAITDRLAGYRLVLLEGCDGVGKSTTAARLAEFYGYIVIHSPATPSTVDLAARYHGLVTAPGRRVLDRAFVSELVYGPILRSTSRLTIEQSRQLAALVAEHGGVLVHLTANPAVLQSRLRARQREHVPSLDQLQHLLDRYDAVIDDLSNHLTVIRVCTVTDPLE
ncbi:AAA family ATPase [Dactylosporangium sp. CA-152071]|uniref:AAA family ATPase n=1 Tax=Dactylosporangium sp. CA-152071 TaxID=3239933 RepID=UPI003D92B4C9